MTWDQLREMLRETRQDAGLTQLEVSARIGVTRARFSEWERGVNSPSIHRFVLWVNALGLTLSVTDRTTKDSARRASLVRLAKIQQELTVLVHEMVLVQ